MHCNGSKKAAPKVHVVASTWSSSVELPVQRMLMGIASDLGFTLFGGDATDTYVHYPTLSETYMEIDEAYAD